MGNSTYGVTMKEEQVEHHCKGLDENGYEIYSEYCFLSKKYAHWEMKMCLGNEYADHISVNYCPYCGSPLFPVSTDIYRAEILISPGHFKVLATVGARNLSEACYRLSGYTNDRRFKIQPDWVEWIKQGSPVSNEPIEEIE
jgi:hypothetical protein